MKSVKPQYGINDADISKILTPFFDNLKNTLIKQMEFYCEIRYNIKDGLYFAVVETVGKERTLKIMASSYFSHEKLFYLNVVQVRHYLQAAQDGIKSLLVQKIHGKTTDELAQSLAEQSVSVMALCERFFGAKLFAD